jgi:hypothetical protein
MVMSLGIGRAGMEIVTTPLSVNDDKREGQASKRSK